MFKKYVALHIIYFWNLIFFQTGNSHFAFSEDFYTFGIIMTFSFLSEAIVICEKIRINFWTDDVLR